MGEIVKKKAIYGQVAEYMDYCCHVRNMSQMTINNKHCAYKHFIIGSECADLEKLGNEDFHKWVRYQKERSVSARTINMRIAHIVAMVRYHREMGMSIPIKLPLIRKLKEGAVRRVFYSQKQIEKVLKLADDMAWLLIKICFDAGLRISELRNMRLDNLKGRRIKFIGKGLKLREAYMSREACEKLQEWILRRGVTDRLWVSSVGAQYSVNQIRTKMQKPFLEAGLSDFYPHALRHSFGTDIHKKGASLLEMQQMLGHSNAETTQRYIHGLDGRLESLFAKYRGEKARRKRQRKSAKIL